MTQRKMTEILAAAILIAAAPAAAFAQAQTCDLSGAPVTTLRTPLIPNVPTAPPGTTAGPGLPESIGDNNTSVGINPGMVVPPTTIPSVPVLPANNIANPSYRVPLDPAATYAPGQLSQIPVPPPPSTPGCDPGIVHTPMDYYPPPVSVVSVNPNGGISGGAPTTRWGGGQTHDFGRYKAIGTRSYDYGVEQQFGSWSQNGLNHERAGAYAVQDLYGRRYALRNGTPPIQTIAPY